MQLTAVDQNADADDPAIYVNATNSADSLVLTSVKNAGLRVYDLSVICCRQLILVVFATTTLTYNTVLN